MTGGQDLALQKNRGSARAIHSERALDQLFGFVWLAVVKQPLRVVQIRLRRFLLLAHHVVKLGQAHLHARIFRLDFEQAVQHFDGFGSAIGFQMNFGNLQEKRPRLAEHALLNVEIGEAFERGKLRRRELGNLFVNRDGLTVESVVEIDLREALEIFDGLGHVALAGEQIANGHQGGLIFRVVTQDLLVLADGLGDLALVEEFQRAFERFIFVKGHGWSCIPGAAPRPDPASGERGQPTRKVSTRGKAGSMKRDEVSAEGDNRRQYPSTTWVVPGRRKPSPTTLHLHLADLDEGLDVGVVGDVAEDFRGFAPNDS